MSPIVVGVIGLAVFFLLLFAGVPIAFCLAGVGFGGLVWLLGWDQAVSFASTAPFNVASSYDISCLPLFILMASVCFVSGIGKDLYALCAKWLGGLPGGLAIATIGACAIFSAISASGIATALTIGLVALPEMKRYDYGAGLVSGSICAGGTLGPLIPPSSLLIYYGMLTQTSIGQLFIAGVIPGILLAVSYAVAIYIVCKRNPAVGPKAPKVGLKQKVAALKTCGDTLLLIVVVLGGLIFGLFTPTEAGAMGALGAIVIAIARRRLGWRSFVQAICETMRFAGFLYLVLMSVELFMPFTTVSGMSAALFDLITELNMAPILVMLIIIAMYLVLGTVMEETSMIFVTLPIIFPIVDKLGFDLIWFGVIVVLVMGTATISPPVGINMFVIAGMDPDVSMGTIYKGTIPFLAANVVVILLILFVPQIVSFLPSIM